MYQFQQLRKKVSAESKTSESPGINRREKTRQFFLPIIMKLNETKQGHKHEEMINHCTSFRAAKFTNQSLIKEATTLS